jgi:phosphate transport system permease protein
MRRGGQDRLLIKTRNRKCEKVIEILFLLSALISVFSLSAITVYLFAKGFPAIWEIGIMNFIFGMEWNPTADNPSYGIFPMIYASAAGTVGAVFLSVPVGLSAAVLLAAVAPPSLANFLRPCVDLMSGIPSVVYGYFGLTVIVPLISEYLGGPGNSLLAVIVLLSVMILPTIIKISENSLRTVPVEIIQGSYALGAAKMETVLKVMIPAAGPGILSSIVLGIGRAIGETMAVILVCGNAAQIPRSVLDMVRPMTANIALEMSYADPFHESVLFGTGVVLFIFIAAVNIVINVLSGNAAKFKDKPPHYLL